MQRHFTADRPNALWLADVTYVPTDEGFLYLAAVLDVFSRYIVGWAMEAHLGSRLVLAALRMAYAQLHPQEVIHHSDHGSEYTAVAFSSRCRELGITISMGSVGDCFDNAMMESFFSSLEAEVLNRYRFATREQARTKLFAWIEGWYNSHRLHSAIDLSPREFELAFMMENARPSAAPIPFSREAASRGTDRSKHQDRRGGNAQPRNKLKLPSVCGNGSTPSPNSPRGCGSSTSPRTRCAQLCIPSPRRPDASELPYGQTSYSACLPLPECPRLATLLSFADIVGE